MTPRSPFQRFMAELRRRHVPQTVAVYVVAAWAAIQFADVIVPNLDWPPGVVTAVIIAAAVGFPVVIALAWFLEWGPEGVHRTEAEPEPAESTGPTTGARGQPIAPRASYAPWAAAVGVLSVGIAAALVVVALQNGGDTTTAVDDDPRTRSERRQAGGDHPAIPPLPHTITSPGFADSLARSTSDSVMRALEMEGFDGSKLGPLIEMARRIGESTARMAAAGPVEILEPENWRYGAPQPVNPGDTVIIQGVARAEEGVVSVEVNGQVVAQDEDGAAELPFRATIVAGEGTGFRRVRVVVRLRDGEPLHRDFSLTLVPRQPEG